MVIFFLLSSRLADLYVALYFVSAEGQCVFFLKMTAFHWVLICIGLEQATVIMN